MSVSIEGRKRIARRQAKSLALRMIQRGSEIELRDADGRVFLGALSAVETYLRERYRTRRPGPARVRPGGVASDKRRRLPSSGGRGDGGLDDRCAAEGTRADRP
jgi:hypothetical protein